MAPRKKIARVEKPVREPWTIVDAQGHLKYQPALGTQIVGFDEELARSLAANAHPSHGWRAVPVSEVHSDGEG